MSACRTKTPGQVIMLGMILLALANVGQYLIQKKLALPENVADFSSGLLMGAAIGTLLLGVALHARDKKR